MHDTGKQQPKKWRTKSLALTILLLLVEAGNGMLSNCTQGHMRVACIIGF